MLKCILIFTIAFTSSIKCLAVLGSDAVALIADEVSQAMILGSDISDLIEEVTPDCENPSCDSPLKAEQSIIKDKMYEIHSNARQTGYMIGDLGYVLNPPSLRSGVSGSIRQTTRYIRKMKRIIGRVAALRGKGVQTAAAIETNNLLVQIMNNQALQMTQFDENEMNKVIREQNEIQAEERFIQEQRQIRRSYFNQKSRK
jgi:hypothetical protein